MIALIRIAGRIKIVLIAHMGRYVAIAHTFKQSLISSLRSGYFSEIGKRRSDTCNTFAAAQPHDISDSGIIIRNKRVRIKIFPVGLSKILDRTKLHYIRQTPLRPHREETVAFKILFVKRIYSKIDTDNKVGIFFSDIGYNAEKTDKTIVFCTGHQFLIYCS